MGDALLGVRLDLVSRAFDFLRNPTITGHSHFEMPAPYDQSVKLLGDDHPDALLYLLTGMPPDSIAESCDRELNVETMRADHLFRMKDGSLIHLEFYSEYDSQWKNNQIRKAALLTNKFWSPLRSVMALLTAHRAPRHIPESIKVILGAFHMSLTVEVKRLWQIPARRALDFGNPALYPWTVLLNASPSEEIEAVDRVVKSGSESLRLQMAMLAELRYRGHRDLLKRLLERMDIMTIDEVLAQSPSYKRVEKKVREEAWEAGLEAGLEAGRERGLQEGLQEGRMKGLQEGRLEGEKRLFRQFVANRFGPLPDWAESRLEAASSESIERWAASLSGAATLEQALS